ncbi:MAG: winged helix-turn-helix domain-containing protein, partial [Gemmatimonadetes bacterium]|nr:winged helix-turn-helix domain-containing protein [Gemmatimonadota bacterium]
MERLSARQARRLALARGGLLRPRHTGLPDRAAGRGLRARDRCHSVIDRFGYLQLDSVAVTGARTHSIVLASRLERFDADLGEELLQPGEPLFEYWGHEASWMPMELYPVFGFRRREHRIHP